MKFNVKLQREFEVEIEAENLEAAEQHARQAAVSMRGRVVSIEAVSSTAVSDPPAPLH